MTDRPSIWLKGSPYTALTPNHRDRNHNGILRWTFRMEARMGRRRLSVNLEK
jgi:hypothetical protein